MRSEKVIVRSGGAIVSTIDVEQFDSVEEAQEALGNDVVLALVNAQHRANESNKARAKATELTPEQKKKVAEYMAKVKSGQV